MIRMHGWRMAVAVCLSAFVLQASGQERKGIRVVASENGVLPRPAFYSESHALIIGVGQYADTSGFINLDSVQAELDQVEDVLRLHGFSITRIHDPDGFALKSALRDFARVHGQHSGSRLLVYYSGHGHSLGPEGFLVPAGVPSPYDDPWRFRAHACSMKELVDMFKDIPARHVLFVFDSCFSGTVFTVRSVPDILPEFIAKRVQDPVRQFITAGQSHQNVPARSVFTPLFVRALRGEGDIDGNGFIVGSELGMFLYDNVVKDKRVQQNPQEGKLQDGTYNRGDFVFVAPTPHEITVAELDSLRQDATTVSVQESGRISGPTDREGGTSWLARNWGWVVGGIAGAGGGAVVAAGGGGGSGGGEEPVSHVGTWTGTEESSFTTPSSSVLSITFHSTGAFSDSYGVTGSYTTDGASVHAAGSYDLGLLRGTRVYDGSISGRVMSGSWSQIESGLSFSGSFRLTKN